MVMVLDAQAAVTPAGNPVAEPIPVAPVVVCVMFVNAVLIHNVGVDEADPTDNVDALLNTSISPELRSELDKSTVPFPVAPLITHVFQAAPIDASSKLVVLFPKS